MSWLGDQCMNWLPGIDSGSTRRVVILSEDREVAVDELGHPVFARLDDFRLIDSQHILVGTLKDVTYFAVRVTEAADFKFESLRPVLINLDSENFIPVNASVQMLDFSKDHRFCGRCGQQIKTPSKDRGRKCETCNLVQYPRISPCIIVLITRGKEVLLARAPHFVGGMYSTLAGFLESGESAEHACHREVLEEVGVRIENPIYQGSQSWPFKHSLMLGYRAAWKSGNIQIDGLEIVDARWFKIDSLPKLPPRASISRGMIDAFVGEQLS